MSRATDRSKLYTAGNLPARGCQDGIPYGKPMPVSRSKCHNVVNGSVQPHGDLYSSKSPLDMPPRKRMATEQSGLPKRICLHDFGHRQFFLQYKLSSWFTLPLIFLSFFHNLLRVIKLKKNKISVYLLSILLVAVVAAIGGWVTAKGMPAYDLVQKPLLSPPDIVFSIVWSVLYLLMAIGSAIVFLSPDSLDRDQALVAYVFQLAANLIWSFLFFGFGLYGLAFIWLLILIALVVLMILKFYRVSKAAALMQLPYFLWLLIAAYLNLSVFLLNR